MRAQHILQATHQFSRNCCNELRSSRHFRPTGCPQPHGRRASDNADLVRAIPANGGVIILSGGVPVIVAGSPAKVNKTRASTKRASWMSFTVYATNTLLLLSTGGRDPPKQLLGGGGPYRTWAKQTKLGIYASSSTTGSHMCPRLAAPSAIH